MTISEQKINAPEPSSAAGSSANSKQQKDLSTVFKPLSIAVIGATPNPEKIGHEILKNILAGGYAGKIFAVHPQAKEILGVKTFPSVKDIPQPVDFAIIVIPAPGVEAALLECGEKGVQSVAIITSGFAEVGKIAEEKRLKEIAERYHMNLLGPNMFGIVYTPSKLNASFGPGNILPGKIAFITQSGALAIALMGWTVMEKIGLSSLVNVGNKADIEERELIEYFNQDSGIDSILIYMEGLKSGRQFMTTKVSKPVIILKVGRSKKGAKAASSHTGSLSGSDKIYDGVFKQLGMLRAQSFTEAFGWARALSLPLPDGEETVIVTNGGGIGVRTTDECEEHGIELLDDPEWLESQFRSIMPSFGSTKNPVDITGQAGAEGYRKAAHICFQEARIGQTIFLYCETAITEPIEIAKGILEEYRLSGKKKPVVAYFVGGEKSRNAINYLNENGIPAYNSVNEAVSSLKVVSRWKEVSRRKKDSAADLNVPPRALEIIQSAKSEKRSVLMEHEAKEILGACGVPMAPWAFARNADEAVALAKDLYPLAMKITSPDIIHKTDVGGVALNIKNEKELREKFQDMFERIKRESPQSQLMGVNLTQMVKGIECIVGLTQDPQFGPAVMFGLGGVFVEVLKDVEFRVVPFGEVEAARMIQDIKGYAVLDGFRGMKAHKQSLCHSLCAIQKVAQLVKELDINPLITNDAGSYAVDARIIL